MNCNITIKKTPPYTTTQILHNYMFHTFALQLTVLKLHNSKWYFIFIKQKNQTHIAATPTTILVSFSSLDHTLRTDFGLHDFWTASVDDSSYACTYYCFLHFCLLHYLNLVLLQLHLVNELILLKYKWTYK